MKNIFISSTYIDCKEYRNAVKEAIESFNDDELKVIGMELFGSRKETSLEVCLSEVNNADIYILIVAHRYGTIDKNSKKSYTELEYDEAVKKSITILVYFLNDDVPVMPKYIDKDENYNKLVNFKKKLAEKHTYSTFCNSKELKKLIKDDLARELGIKNEVENKFNFNDIKLRPQVYNYEEYEIIIELANYDIQRLDSDIVKNLNLTLGNSLYICTKINTNDNREENINLIFHKQFSNWIINEKNKNKYVEDGHIHVKTRFYKVKVRFLYTHFIDEYTDDYGKIVSYVREFIGYEVIEKPTFIKCRIDKMLIEDYYSDLI